MYIHRQEHSQGCICVMQMLMQCESCPTFHQGLQFPWLISSFSACSLVAIGPFLCVFAA